MDEKDFDAFKKSIEHERQIEFEEGGWADLKVRMDEAENRKRRPVLGWWTLAAAAVVLPLIVGNVFLFGNLQETRKVNERLEKNLEAFSKTDRDTVWQERVVYVHDTLIGERVVYRNMPVEPEKYRQLKTLLTDQEMATLLAGKLPDRLRDLPSETPSSKSENKEAVASQNIDYQEEIINSKHVPDLLKGKNFGPIKSSTGDKQGLMAYLPEIKLVEKKTPFLVKAQRVMRPEGLAVGATLGGLLPISEELDQPNGWSAGLLTEVIFSKHLALRMEGNYARVNFTSESMKPSLGIPVIASPGDDYVFREAKVAQNAMYLNVGMKYTLNIMHKLQPFVYGGYGTSTILPHSVYYNFENKALPNPELTVPLESNKSIFISGFGIAGVGISWSLSDKFSLSLEGDYRRQFSKTSLSNPDLLSLRTGLTYQF